MAARRRSGSRNAPAGRLDSAFSVRLLALMLTMLVRLGRRRARLMGAVALHHLHHHPTAAALTAWLVLAGLPMSLVVLMR
jgi:hypothetical protein